MRKLNHCIRCDQDNLDLHPLSKLESSCIKVASPLFAVGLLTDEVVCNTCRSQIGDAASDHLLFNHKHLKS
jgi:hypothetical protein